MGTFSVVEKKCATCKSNCVWSGKETSGHGKCFVGYTPVTKADLIRAMNDEELADELLEWFACFMAVEWSRDMVLDLLKQEVRDD